MPNGIYSMCPLKGLNAANIALTCGLMWLSYLTVSIFVCCLSRLCCSRKERKQSREIAVEEVQPKIDNANDDVKDSPADGKSEPEWQRKLKENRLFRIVTYNNKRYRVKRRTDTEDEYANLMKDASATMAARNLAREHNRDADLETLPHIVQVGVDNAIGTLRDSDFDFTTKTEHFDREPEQALHDYQLETLRGIPRDRAPNHDDDHGGEKRRIDTFWNSELRDFIDAEEPINNLNVQPERYIRDDNENSRNEHTTIAEELDGEQLDN